MFMKHNERFCNFNHKNEMYLFPLLIHVCRLVKQPFEVTRWIPTPYCCGCLLIPIRAFDRFSEQKRTTFSFRWWNNKTCRARNIHSRYIFLKLSEFILKYNLQKWMYRIIMKWVGTCCDLPIFNSFFILPSLF